MTHAVMGQQTAPAAAPAAAWQACPECGELLYVNRLRRNLGVCTECGHHLRLPARERIEQLVDPGTFAALPPTAHLTDPLAFIDVRPYADRLVDAAQRSGETEAVVAGTAKIDGTPIVLLVMNFDFLAGSMGVEVGRRVTQAAERALHERVALVAVCASGGARMQEGVLSLVQMTRTSQAFGRLDAAGLLSVCVLTDPTYGGVSASFAALGSVVLAERGAHVGFAGPRVVEQTIRQPLPAGFQTAEFLLAHGLVDRVEHRADLRALLIRLLRLHPAPGSPPAPADRVDRGSTRPGPDASAPAVAPERPALDRPAPAQGPRQDAWDVVQTARDVNRPTTREYLELTFDDFVELHGDRAYADDPALVAGVASIGGRSVVVLGQQKGRTVQHLVATNFGMAHPEGYRKALRMLGYAERFGFPVVTLVDTPGAHPGLEAEQRGQFIAIAEMIQRISGLRTPVVSVITGEGGSGGALALCAADRLLMLEHSYLSVISPEGCAAILWRQSAEAPRAARALRLGSAPLRDLGIAHGIVPEPPGGAQADPLDAARRLRAALIAELDDVCALTPQALVDERALRFDMLDQRRM